MQRTLNEHISRKQWACPRWEESRSCSHSEQEDEWRRNTHGKGKEKEAKIAGKVQWSHVVWQDRGQHQGFSHRASLRWPIKSFPRLVTKFSGVLCQRLGQDRRRISPWEEQGLSQVHGSHVPSLKAERSKLHQWPSGLWGTRGMGLVSWEKSIYDTPTSEQ